MEVCGGMRPWGEVVVEVTKAAQKKETDAVLWAVEVYSNLKAAGESLPSLELAEVLVSYICWDNNVPILWKFLEKALLLNFVPPIFLLSLLSLRVIPCRRSQPAAYRLYLELLRRHAFQLKSHINTPNYPNCLMHRWMTRDCWNSLLKRSPDGEHCTKKWNGMKIIALRRLSFMNSCKMQILLRLLRLLGNLCRTKPAHWFSFVQRLQLLAANSSALRNSGTLSPEAFLQLTSDKYMVLTRECKTSSQQKFHAVMGFEYLSSSASLCHGASHSAIWIPLDLVLEDAMDGYQVSTTSGIEIISGLVRTLRAINGTSWHDTFLGLWLAALRLVQREREPIEGPMPRLDTRLCMLLGIIPIVIADLIEEEERTPVDETETGPTDQWKEERVPGKCRNDLVSTCSLHLKSVVAYANQAAAKAMLFVSGITPGSAYFDCLGMKEMPIDCSGNMHHLIVEACIARGLLDTSAYLWPGYVNGRINQLPQCMQAQVPGWASFMKGAPLTSVMANALVSSPASSLAELEKIFKVATGGSEDEKIFAASILCGASLIRGWNIQEHTVQFIIRLLSPSKPAENTEGYNHLINYARLINVVIVGIAPVDCVQIFSLHGLVPTLACSLMPICEVFGSCVPNVSWKLTSGEEISAHAVFSNAFILLLRLWRFDRPPLEHGIGDVPTVGSQLTPEYLLLVRNSHLMSTSSVHNDRNRMRLSTIASLSSPDSVFVDSFPKLKAWYRQHQACIASTLSGLVHGTPFHQIVEGLLNMMTKKINRGNQNSITISGSSSSSGPGNDDASLRPKLPAWDILEAIPFVVDAALTACAHGRLSPRELAIGMCFNQINPREHTKYVLKYLFYVTEDNLFPNLKNLPKLVKTSLYLASKIRLSNIQVDVP
ncbi:hypothetical protein Ahy_B01g055835 isoform B [Arachis hypogaea]|uniref:Mediator of RNA polymerase II transcription subunit 33A n=1 Tax=Arachis hypogaea TaxID=3818 RepID=A0A445AX88_ARAHY|nr:hypothetical protein Ahy_B01g055835 isoform B [Arachis hypogaea]